MLELRVKRYLEIADVESGDGCTISNLELYDGYNILFSCYGIEPAGPATTERDLDRRIPVGEYNVEWAGSSMTGSKIKGKLPLLYNDLVPRDRRIRIHVGNTGRDTLGCICPGMEARGDRVVRSKEALTKLLDLTFEKELKVVIVSSLGE